MRSLNDRHSIKEKNICNSQSKQKQRLGKSTFLECEVGEIQLIKKNENYRIPIESYFIYPYAWLCFNFLLLKFKDTLIISFL